MFLWKGTMTMMQKLCCFRRSILDRIALPLIQKGHGERQLQEGRTRDEQELKDALGGLVS
jgi:hypothetical protein